MPHGAWCKADTHVPLSLSTKMENHWEMTSDKNSKGEQLQNEPKYSSSASVNWSLTGSDVTKPGLALKCWIQERINCCKLHRYILICVFA